MSASRIPQAAMMLLVGVAVGGIIGFSLGRRGAVATANKSRAKMETQSVGMRSKKTSASSNDAEESSQVLLGNITTVPFQELYSVLLSLPEEKLNELVAQLNKLSDGKENEATIATFFKAWAHIDPKAALRAAIMFKSAEAKTTTIASVIESADVTQAEALARAIKEWPESAISRGQRNNFLPLLLQSGRRLRPSMRPGFTMRLP